MGKFQLWLFPQVFLSFGSLSTTWGFGCLYVQVSCGKVQVNGAISEVLITCVCVVLDGVLQHLFHFHIFTMLTHGIGNKSMVWILKKISIRCT